MPKRRQSSDIAILPLLASRTNSPRCSSIDIVLQGIALLPQRSTQKCQRCLRTAVTHVSSLYSPLDPHQRQSLWNPLLQRFEREGAARHAPPSRRPLSLKPLKVKGSKGFALSGGRGGSAPRLPFAMPRLYPARQW